MNIESEKRLSSVINYMVDGVIVIDERGTIDSFNSAAERIFGYAASEAIGKNVKFLMPEPYQSQHDQYLQNHVKTGIKKIIGIGREVVGLRKDGTTFPMDLAVSAAEIEGYRIFTGIIRDITERKQAQEKLNVANTELLASLKELEEANLRLIEADTHKSQFLSSMSHELRTPLNAILGFTDLLQNQYFGSLNEKQLQYVDQVGKSGKHLLELIGDLLNISKIDAGVMSLEPGEVRIAEFISDIADMMHTQFKARELTVKISLDPSLKTIVADARKLKQIFLNLLSNAIKYSPVKGVIEIGAALENETVRFFVSDTGIGIADEHKEKLFSEFYQVNRKRDENLGGTGIGLALTRRLVKLHGGDIGVQSSPGKGSTFWFTLPKCLEIPKDDSKTVESATPMKSHRILVVEDNDVNLALILDMLSVHDHNVIAAKNGKDAIDMARCYKPDLILMDIRMPVMSGFEAILELRALPETSHIPVIAVTASVEEENREKYIAAGFSDYLPKPIDSASLTSMMKRFLK